jgi:hypothetical protein
MEEFEPMPFSVTGALESEKTETSEEDPTSAPEAKTSLSIVGNPGPAFTRLRAVFQPDEDEEYTDDQIATIILEEWEEDKQAMKKARATIQKMATGARNMLGEEGAKLPFDDLVKRMETARPSETKPSNTLLESQEVKEAIEEAVDTETRKLKMEIARLRKELMEKDEFEHTFQSLKFGQSGRISHVEDEDSDGF